MALARLTAHTTFDQTDGAGMLLDAMHDSYFKLDPCQTLMLAALLEAPSMGEAIARLAEEIEAEDSELYQTLVHFYLQLAAQGLVRTAVELADAGIAYDALGGTKDVASVAE